MIEILKKISVLIYINIIFFLVCGCWDYSELDQMALVTGFGFDLDENDRVIMTYQVLKPSPGEKQGAGDGENETVIFEDEGKTVFDAVRNVSMKSSKKLYFAHSQVMVLGNRAARVNPEGLLRIFRRDHGSRTIDYVVVAENTAAEIIKGKGGLDKIQALDLSNLIRDYKQSGKIVPTRLEDIAMAMLSPASSPVLPIVRLDEEDRTYISGTAVFRDKKMVGSLNDDETRGFLWITSQLKSGSLTVKDADKDALISFEILGASSSYKVEFDENITIEIKFQAVTELINSIKSTENVTVDELIEMQKAEITKKVYMALKKASFYKSDIFGFGNYIYAYHPKQWKSLEKNWDDVFTKINYKVNIDLQIKSQGLLTDKFKEK